MSFMRIHKNDDRIVSNKGTSSQKIYSNTATYAVKSVEFMPMIIIRGISIGLFVFGVMKEISYHVI